jgi:thioredoxin-related protein
MKKILFLLIPIVVVVALMSAKTGEDKGIKFHEDPAWAEVSKMAGKEKKLIFMDIYATWCGPCKMLKRSTFPDKELGEYFNKNFINVSIDGEKGEGPELARKYNIPGYPTLLILDKDGKVVAQTAGYMKAEQLLQFGKDANLKGKKK